MKYLNYKGYTGSIEYSKKDNVLFGKVLGVQGLLSYDGNTDQALEADFTDVIDEYLAHTEKLGKNPENRLKEVLMSEYPQNCTEI